MSDADRPSAAKRALIAIERLQDKVASLERAGSEPIAVIGMGCRFPRADGLDQYWGLLSQGVDAITEVPADRWPAAATAGLDAARWGGFLDHIDRFDPDFFGISRREAASMDPQQRLLLEVVHEALADAGIPADRLMGTATGAFFGHMTVDYLILHVRHVDLHSADVYYGMGNDTAALAGRVSYLLGLQGPSMVVSTACSSSLVATHLACMSLRAGECDVALAGGVSVIATPDVGVYGARMGLTAPDGRCKAFDAAANGYVRGEGCGVVALKRLRDAVADGDRIYAVLHGSAVVHDGASAGLTVPNGAAQRRVIERALHVATGVDAKDVQYVEAHGTGTPLGDPIELRALSKAYGPRTEALDVGTVKTNFGHLEAAAGVAGLIKTALALHRGSIPPSLHLHHPTEHVDWTTLGIRVVTEAKPWTRGTTPRYAGISSFGLSGTNTHAIIGEAPLRPTSLGVDERPRLVAVSGRTSAALTDNAMRLATAARAADRDWLHDAAFTLGARRPHYEHRAALIARSATDVEQALTSVGHGISQSSLHTGRRHDEPRLLMVFSGQGSQWDGMARTLFDTQPVVRAALESVCAALDEHLDVDPLALLTSTDVLPDRVDVVQPLLFAVQVALATWLLDHGVEPYAVIGHSMGEVAAAHVAGALSLNDAASIICARSRGLASIAGRGAMAVVEMTSAQAEDLVRDHAGDIAIAADNGPQSKVLSGTVEVIDAVLTRLAESDVFGRRIKVDVASHSPQVDALLEPLRAALSPIVPRANHIPLLSTVTADYIDGTALDANYWARNLRAPVQFGPAFARLIEDGVTCVAEISPHPLLLPSLESTLRASCNPAVAVPAQHRERDPALTMLEAVAALHVHGVDVAWDRINATGHVLSLPAYAWQRGRYWFTASPADANPGTTSKTVGHPYLGPSISLADATGVHVFEKVIDRDAPSHLRDHVVAGDVVVPAAALVEMLLSAGTQLFGATTLAIHDLAITAPIAVGAEPTRLQVILRDSDAAAVDAEVFSRTGDDSAWTRHATAHLRPNVGSPPDALDPSALNSQLPNAMTGTEHYAALDELGLHYGPSFRGVASIRCEPGEALGEVSLPAAMFVEATHCRIHPVLLDAAFQVAQATTSDRTPRIPVSIDRVEVFAPIPTTVWSRVVQRRRDTVDVDLHDRAGHPVARVAGLKVAAVSSEPGWPLIGLQWRVQAIESTDVSSEGWCVWGADALAVGLEDEMRNRGERVVRNDACTSTDEVQRALYAAFDPQGTDGPSGSTGVVCVIPRSSGLYDASGPSRECQSLLHIAKVLAGVAWRNKPRLWLVTQGSHSHRTETALAGAAAWGMTGVISNEHPQLRCVRVDVDSESQDLEALADELLRGGREPQVALHDGVRAVARLAPVEPPTSEAIANVDCPEGTILITGAFGGLGPPVARALVARGAQSLLLLSRRGSDDERRKALVEELREGATVHVARGDVANMADLDAAMTLLGDSAPLTGIIHAAGALQDGLIVNQTFESFERVLAPKVAGGWNLHQLSLRHPVEMFVLYSSAAALLGSPGQSNYAAANAFLDALAQHRRRRGLAAISINWGLFSGDGLGAGTAERFADRGIDALTPDQGAEALFAAIATERAAVAVLPFNARQWTEYYPHIADDPYLSELIRTEGVRGGEVAERIAQAPATERRSLLQDYLREQIEHLLHLSPGELRGSEAFKRYGADSVVGLELRNRVEAGLGLRLSATLMFTYATLDALTAHLADRLGYGIEEPMATVEPTTQAADDGLDDLSDEDLAARLAEKLGM